MDDDVPRRRDTRPPRASTLGGGPPTADSNALAIEQLQRDVWELTRELAELLDGERERRELLVELAGRDGRGGVIAYLREQQEKSAASQGKRIGELETKAAQFALTRAQLALLGVLGLAILAAALKVFVSG